MITTFARMVVRTLQDHSPHTQCPLRIRSVRSVQERPALCLQLLDAGEPLTVSACEPVFRLQASGLLRRARALQEALGSGDVGEDLCSGVEHRSRRCCRMYAIRIHLCRGRNRKFGSAPGHSQQPRPHQRSSRRWSLFASHLGITVVFVSVEQLSLPPRVLES